MFFLDSQRRGRVSIPALLCSPILAEFMELKDPTLSDISKRQNWFSGTACKRAYGQFVLLDKSRNGLIDKTELQGYRNGSLTPIFIDRVFQVVQTYQGQLVQIVSHRISPDTSTLYLQSKTHTFQSRFLIFTRSWILIIMASTSTRWVFYCNQSRPNWPSFILNHRQLKMCLLNFLIWQNVSSAM